MESFKEFIQEVKGDELSKLQVAYNKYKFNLDQNEEKKAAGFLKDVKKLYKKVNAKDEYATNASGKTWSLVLKDLVESETLDEAYKKVNIELGGPFVITKLGYDANGNWSYMVQKGRNTKKVQHQGNWSQKITKDDKTSDIEDSKIAKEIIDYYNEFLGESINEGKVKPFIGKSDGMNFAVQLEGFDNMSLKGGNFGTQVKMNKFLREFKKDAKETRVASKGKATLASVKAWVKENNPTEFFAKWKPDSTSYKEDSVTILYKEGGK